MSELTIYDSKGRRYTADGPTSEQNDRIEDFFFAGVRLAIDASSVPEVITFFRAKESANARSEQFYAVYSGARSRDLLVEFKRELEDRVETEWGHILDTSTDDMAVFRELDRTHDAVPGDQSTHDAVARLLNDGERLQFETATVEGAITFIGEFLRSGAAQKVAVCTDATSSTLSSYDLVVAPGGSADLTPVGGTESKLAIGRQQQQEDAVRNRVQQVKDAIGRMQSVSGLGDTDVRNLVFDNTPVFPQAGTSTATVSLSQGQRSEVYNHLSSVENAVDELRSQTSLSDEEIRSRLQSRILLLQDSNGGSQMSSTSTSTSTSSSSSSFGGSSSTHSMGSSGGGTTIKTQDLLVVVLILLLGIAGAAYFILL